MGNSSSKNSGSDVKASAKKDLSFKSKPVLMYFNIPGIAEPIRLALAIGNIDFEDKRVEFADWPEVKKTMPFGQMPLYMEGDVTLTQQTAILRHVGRKVGLYPSCPLKAAYVDRALDSIKDMQLDLRFILLPNILGVIEWSTEEKAKLCKALADDVLPNHLRYLEKLLDNHPGAYFMGDELSIADLYLTTMLGWLSDGSLNGIPTTVADCAPKLQALAKKVRAHPKVKAWYAKSAAK